MVKKNYKEGDWFLVPLDPSGFAVGLAARNTPRGACILAYFFGVRYDEVPHISDLENYRPSDAVRIFRVGDLGIINGEWKVLGQASNWNRSWWPMPNFVRREPISNRIWLVTYSDDNPSLVLTEKLINQEEAFGLGTDSLYGYGAAEKTLLKLLN